MLAAIQLAIIIQDLLLDHANETPENVNEIAS